MLRRLVAHLLARVPPTWRRRLATLPLVDGAVRLVSHRLSPPGARMWLEVQAGPAAGLRLHLDPRFESDFWLGRHERLLQERLAGTVRPGWTVYDVGAQIGFFALLAARLVGPGGTVHAFEPDAANIEQILEHLEANRATNVHVEPVAVWSRNGSVTFTTEETAPVRFTGKVDEASSGERVAAVTLDAFAAEHRAPHVIKIDVEGGEEDVLAGAGRVLAEHRPIILCEVHLEGGGQAQRLERVRSLLEAAGYAVEHLTPGSDPTHVFARHPEGRPT